jgi:hypothetical protein
MEGREGTESREARLDEHEEEDTCMSYEEEDTCKSREARLHERNRNR